MMLPYGGINIHKIILIAISFSVNITSKIKHDFLVFIKSQLLIMLSIFSSIISVFNKLLAFCIIVFIPLTQILINT